MKATDPDESPAPKSIKEMGLKSGNIFLISLITLKATA
jgi:hypothetical protein